MYLEFQRLFFTLKVFFAYIGTPFLPSTIGMLEMEVISFFLPRLTLNLALMAGSSKQGKARLASVGWNWVTAMYL